MSRSVAIVSPAKTAKPIDMPFWAWTLVDPRNHVLDGRPDVPMWMGNFDGETLPARKMAGWKSKIKNSSTMESELWRNAVPSAFQLQETTLRRDKIWRTCLVLTVSVYELFECPSCNSSHSQQSIDRLFFCTTVYTYWCWTADINGAKS